VGAQVKENASQWDDSSRWYQGCVGTEGHFDHRTLILPNVLAKLQRAQVKTILDVGCGQGILERHIDCDYVGIDGSHELIRHAIRGKKRDTSQYVVADAATTYLEGALFDAIVFILSLQNMERPDEAIREAQRHLQPDGQMIFVLNHPAFRIPRQSGWVVDAGRNVLCRQMHLYMSEEKIPIQTHPSQQQASPITFSQHFSLSKFSAMLQSANLVIATIDEWCSQKESHGLHAKRENRARREFPLFLAITAIAKK
jgi:ubiquinone/menaquinone biosynthesis C-methylase UbiE